MAIPSVYLVTNGVHESWMRDIIKGASRYAVRHGRWDLRLANPVYKELDVLPSAAGLMIHTRHWPRSADLSSLPRPAVGLGEAARGSSLPRVITDNRRVGEEAARHLLTRATRSFLYVGLSSEDFRFSHDRAEGFQRILEVEGLPLELFFLSRFVWSQEWDGATRLTMEGEQAKLEDLLRSLPKPIGVMACNDVIARRVCWLCKDRGLNIPEHVAVVGVDDDCLECNLSSPTLSSVQPDFESYGYRSAELLDRLMAGLAPPEKPIMITPKGVVARESTGVSPLLDREVALAHRFIEDNAHWPLEVGDVVEAVPLSRRTLERRFTAVLGISPREAIRRAHVERAKRLLAETTLPMEVVAARSGYANANLLYMAFRKATDESPSAYRKRFASDATDAAGEDASP